VLDNKTLNKIKAEGFTRMPVYSGKIDNVVGVLYAKDLINIKLGTKVEKIYKKENVLKVSRKEKLDKLLNIFIKSKTHIAFVKNEYRGLVGVVTLEDVLEEIIRREIVDETDKVTDMQEMARKRVIK
jgi:metal transporter CNNM